MTAPMPPSPPDTERRRFAMAWLVAAVVSLGTMPLATALAEVIIAQASLPFPAGTRASTVWLVVVAHIAGAIALLTFAAAFAARRRLRLERLRPGWAFFLLFVTFACSMGLLVVGALLGWWSPGA